ncbi:hypothetical protein GCM10022222_16740 [Amycolatopsis ultiminotia]|uniref:XRE family transcriptional regulator n=1 Tax=Amycolatopsis ultiminotia TaxID=543629 RepID=A0ABP6VDV6_9PSEU
MGRNMPALGQVGKQAATAATPEVVTLATRFTELYHCLPSNSMVRNAADLHVSQPSLSQYANGQRVPPVWLLVTMHQKAATQAAQGNLELPCTLDELLEARAAAKASLRSIRFATTRLSTPPLTGNPAMNHETAGNFDRRNGKTSPSHDRRNEKCGGPPASTSPPGAATAGPSSSTAADVVAFAIDCMRAGDCDTAEHVLGNLKTVLADLTVDPSSRARALGIAVSPGSYAHDAERHPSQDPPHRDDDTGRKEVRRRPGRRSAVTESKHL